MGHQRAPANQLCCTYRAQKGVFDETGSNASACPFPIGGELSKQQAWNRIGWLTSPDGSRQGIGHDSRWGETVKANDSFCLVNDDYGCEAFCLIGECAGLEPVIEGRFAAIEFGKFMLRGQRFRL